MKRVRVGGPALILTSLVFAGSSALAAEKVTVRMEIELRGFHRADVGGFFQSTDMLANSSRCLTRNFSSCSVESNFDNPPKNISVSLLRPSTLNLVPTPRCEQLLGKEGAKTCNRDYRAGSISACQWRTKESGTASWRWIVTYVNPGYSLDCETEGFAGKR